MPVDLDRNVHCILGLPFDAVDMPAAVSRVRAAVDGGRPCFLSTPNLNFLVACRDDAKFRASVIDSDLSIVDGMPLVWVARVLGLPIRNRVAGANLFESLARDTKRPLSVYFFGGAPGVAERAAERLNASHGGLVCVGFECPGFGSIEDMSSAATIDRINASGADFVVVALGARKGQAWIARNRFRLNAPVVSHLGAVINFVAGTVDRAPAWIQKLGLEWLWRIREEPRLWRRYAEDGISLLYLMVTRVLPYAWYLWRHRIDETDLEAASAELSQHDGKSILRGHGYWCASNVERLRGLLRQATENGGDIEVALADVKAIDSAVTGLLLLVHGLLERRGRRLHLSGVSPHLRRLLHWQCAVFLLR